MLTVATPAFAEDNAQLWVTTNAETALDDNDKILATIILRSRPDTLNLGQSLLRIGVVHQFKNGISVAGNFAVVTTYRPDRPDRAEHRFAQSISIPITSNFAGGSLDSRLQIEEIFATDGNDLGIRIRPRLRWTLPLVKSKRLSLQITDEMLLAANDTDWGQRAGFQANRFLTGIKVDISKKWTLTPAYTWQLVKRNNAPDRNDHILWLTIDHRL